MLPCTSIDRRPRADPLDVEIGGLNGLHPSHSRGKWWAAGGQNAPGRSPAARLLDDRCNAELYGQGGSRSHSAADPAPNRQSSAAEVREWTRRYDLCRSGEPSSGSRAIGGSNAETAHSSGRTSARGTRGGRGGRPEPRQQREPARGTRAGLSLAIAILATTTALVGGVTLYLREEVLDSPSVRRPRGRRHPPADGPARGRARAHGPADRAGLPGPHRGRPLISARSRRGRPPSRSRA